MKILVSTKKTQGQRGNDFCWVPEGEPVVEAGGSCDGEEIDGSCGCRRSLSGLKNHKATTTFRVAESDLTPVEFHKQIMAHVRRIYGGIKIPDAAIANDATEIMRYVREVANRHPVGTILERRGDIIQARQVVRGAAKYGVSKRGKSTGSMRGSRTGLGSTK